MKRAKTKFPLLNFQKDSRGAALPILAAILGITCTVAAVAVDGAYLYGLQNRLQAVADLAAITAVREIADRDAMNVAIDQLVASNMPPDENGEVVSATDVDLGHWDASNRTFTSDTETPSAVRVVANRTSTNGNPAETFFGRVVGLRHVNLSAEAVATVRPEAPLCLLALNPTANQALNVAGSGSIMASDCAIYSNSSAADSIDLSNGGDFTALHICSHGGAAGTGYSPAPEVNCPAVADPLALLPEPDTAAMPESQFVVQNGRIEFQPGVHPGSGHSGAGHLYFFPGVHVFTGNLQVNSGMRMEGTDVTLIFTGSAYLNITGDTQIDLIAPTAGDYAGVAIYGSRTQTGITHYINGNTSMSVDGTIYLPTSSVQFTGNSTAAITMLVCRSDHLYW